ncbi:MULTISPECIES: DUF3046 domain-containing protein [Klenkia]|uniref:DUF3046 domain-containing protein n=1 Tax=Klenkia taihuensis TaxID=1225127 RepID=A0A1I1V7V9_9ACTN|nr:MULTISPECIES: DUF3046 domain-containing protein [Klenkia]MCO7219297.1 DUF3046 domain-containing protein [Klenkia sp. PcliD-1-E]GHE14471.1 hypothetical protein GCM10011381_41110 [Klenkia taihuensis]SFD79092.1 Protein of unknown function [Klenkia taihuensis]
MRLQEFWGRVREEFGDVRGEAIARDHVFSAFEGRTAVGALDAGVPVRTVWLAICEEFDVPAQVR